MGKEAGFTRFRVNFATQKRYFNIERSRRLLGYEPIWGIEEGMERTLKVSRVFDMSGRMGETETDTRYCLHSGSTRKRRRRLPAKRPRTSRVGLEHEGALFILFRLRSTSALVREVAQIISRLAVHTFPLGSDSERDECCILDITLRCILLWDISLNI